MKYFYQIFVLTMLLGCSRSDTEVPSDEMYFPPLSGIEWQTSDPAEFGWNSQEIGPLLTYLESKHTKGFMILINGKIALEHYFNGHTQTSPWYWASAGKTLTTAMTGIAAQQGLLNTNDPVSDYLGAGWTSAPPAKENLITLKHLLTMSSGLNDALGDNVEPANLQYVADAGTRWAYHNVYVKLQDVIAHTSGMSWDSYFNSQLKSKIGMTGAWTDSGDFSVYWSTTRSMARFGLLMLNNGKWEQQQIINADYLNLATNTSQTLNYSYGYLWWLNGKASYRMPQSQIQFNGSIIPTGPGDMYMALGRDDQKIYVVPSRNMVVIRMGEAADNVNPALSDFDEALWQKISAVVN